MSASAQRALRGRWYGVRDFILLVLLCIPTLFNMSK